jgi:hypothetical protein
MTFLLDEDEALRNLLTGLTVTDQKAPSTNARKVSVWFGQPDQELRNQSYPYITIDMIDIAEDFTRSMRGKAQPVYLANPTTIGTSTTYNSTLHDWEIDYPIPVNIDYQVTTYARQPRHDRQILADLLNTRIPLRFATLNTGTNTAQGTIRRLDVLDISKRDVTEAGKRLFVNAITVRVSSEISPSTYDKFYKVDEIRLDGPTAKQRIDKTELTIINGFTTTAT